MAKIIYTDICKSYGNSLRITRRDGKWKYDGFYIGNHVTIDVDGYAQYGGTIQDHTILVANYNGHRYQRTYNDTFSDHGLKMICARFQKDVLSGHFKPKSKLKFQMPS